MNHRAAAVMTELRRRHRRALQVSAQVFHAAPGTAALFGEVHLPVVLVLRLQVALPQTLVADMAKTGQGAWIDTVIAGAQEANNGATPDGFDLLFFEEQVAPYAVFDIEPTTGDGDVDVRMLIELAALGMQCAEDADFDAQLARVSEHGTSGAAKQVVEQRSVVVEEWPQQVGHGEGDVLPVAVGQDMLLLGDPLLGAFEATAAAGFGLAGLAEEARVSAIGGAAAVVANPHGAGAASEHALDGELGPVAELMAIILEKEFPAFIVLEQKFCGARYVHEAQYKIHEAQYKMRR
jgi:hypothetical protein